MRLIPSEFENETTTTCLCWRLVRTDGVVIGVTDHDAAIALSGLIFEPGAALDAGRFTSTRGLNPSRADAGGALSSEALTEATLSAGLWDGARVDVFRADWANPDAHMQVWSGRLSEITQTGTGFTAELVSLKADLERPVGRVFSRRCDAVLGDARCGIEALGRTCDQRFDTCREAFGNVRNFRGFPHMPGPDAVLAGPAASGNDGSKR